MWYLLLTMCLQGECRAYPFIESRSDHFLHMFDTQQECIDQGYASVEKAKETTTDISVFPLCLPLGEPA